MTKQNRSNCLTVNEANQNGTHTNIYLKGIVNNVSQRVSGSVAYLLSEVEIVQVHTLLPAHHDSSE